MGMNGVNGADGVNGGTTNKMRTDSDQKSRTFHLWLSGPLIKHDPIGAIRMGIGMNLMHLSL